MTDEQLIAKFRHNVEGVLGADDTKAIIDDVFALESVTTVSDLLSRVRPSVPAI